MEKNFLSALQQEIEKKKTKLNKERKRWDLLALQLGNRAFVLRRREKAYICKLAN